MNLQEFLFIKTAAGGRPIRSRRVSVTRSAPKAKRNEKLISDTEAKLRALMGEDEFAKYEAETKAIKKNPAYYIPKEEKSTMPVFDKSIQNKTKEVMNEANIIDNFMKNKIPHYGKTYKDYVNDVITASGGSGGGGGGYYGINVDNSSAFAGGLGLGSLLTTGTIFAVDAAAKKKKKKK